MWVYLPKGLENCPCSVEQGVDCLRASGSKAGEQSVMSKKTSIASGCCELESETACCTMRPYGMTCEHLTPFRGADVSMSSLQDSPASRSVRRGGKGQTQTGAICGPTPFALLERYDPAMCSSKTYPACCPQWIVPQMGLFDISEPYSESWPKAGTMLNGACYRQPSSERPISAAESGLWPTPTVSGNHNRKGLSPASGDGLATAVRRMYPNQRWYDNDQPGGKLNPDWVDWLMGFPVGWTDCAPLEMDRFRLWLQRHGLPYNLIVDRIDET